MGALSDTFADAFPCPWTPPSAEGVPVHFEKNACLVCTGNLKYL